MRIALALGGVYPAFRPHLAGNSPATRVFHAADGKQPHGCAAFQWVHTVMVMIVLKATESTIDAAIMRRDGCLAG